MRRVLLATTDRSLPGLLSAMLVPNGFELHTVEVCAPEHVNSHEYILLILDGDSRLSFTDGLPAVVVIAPRDAVKAYDNGADLVIDKPLRANVLLAKIRAVLRRYGISV